MRAARVLFVVGNGADDTGRTDVLSVAIDEQRNAKQTGRRRVHGTTATYSTYSLYAKTMHFLRHASMQPEPAIVLADDDVFVQPHALLTYAWALLHPPSSGGGSGGGSGVGSTDATSRVSGDDAWYAGRFDWYSWRTERMMATAYWRAMRGALYGAQAPYRNCSPSGNGWVPSADGKSVVREASSVSPGQERCVGPFAFAKGPLVMLSSSAVRWLVTSDRFVHDTARAATMANASQQPGAHKKEALERVPQDVNMGYWLAAHPSLRYVALPRKVGWADAFVEVRGAS